MIQNVGGEKLEKTDKLVSMLILTCYKKISEQQANTILNQEVDKINPLSRENLSLLDLESWINLYDTNDGNAIEEKMEKIQTNKQPGEDKAEL
jgi:hypothetical protein